MILTGRQALAGGASLVVLAAIVAGVMALGSPEDERARRLDQRRVGDLSGIEAAIGFYHRNHQRLPSTLDELRSLQSVRISDDPATGAPYRYRATSAEEFELCGRFERASPPRAGSGVDTWRHPAGDHCFTLRIDERRPR